MLGVCNQLPTALSPPTPQPSSQPQQEPSRTPAPKRASIPAPPLPFPLQDRESVPSRGRKRDPGQPPPPRRNKGAERSCTRRTPRRAPGPRSPAAGHAAPEPRSPGRPIVLCLLSFPEATPPPSSEPGGQETAVHQGDGGGVGERQEDLDPTLPTGTRGMGQSEAT